MEIINRYFPQLSEEQQQQFAQLKPIYEKWSVKINVISRKDMSDFHERHVLHSLATAKRINFCKGTSILDIGTGGSFPGIPLTVLFPECNFTLVNSIEKKIKVVQEVVNTLELKNVATMQTRTEELRGSCDFVVSRTVTQMQDFVPWVEGKFKKQPKNELANGTLYLKGGDLTDELAPSVKAEVTAISEYLEEALFETKKVVYLICQ